MTDQTTTIGDLRQAVAAFIAERDWQQFHDPKNLAMSIGIEAAELMELFQWVRSDQLPVTDWPEETVQKVRDGLADVMCYQLSLANAMEIDVAAAVRDKMARNAQKDPVDRYQGRYD